MPFEIITAVFATAAALYWAIQGTLWAFGMLRLMRLERLPAPDTVGDGAGPSSVKVAVIVPARNEAAQVREAVGSLLRQDFPSLKVIVVEDRSTDHTGERLTRLQKEYPALEVLRITELPQGWLGKTHAIERGAELALRSSRDVRWLLFTDADVVFAPGVVSRAVAYAEAQALDHLTLAPGLEMKGFWEGALTRFFGLIFSMRTQPWKARIPTSSKYVGLGAFNLVRRTAYEAVGRHRRLALDTADDMKLGKLFKDAGFRQELGLAPLMLRVRWQSGVGGMARGLEKNVYGSFGYRLSRFTLALVGLWVTHFLPYLTVWVDHPWTRGPSGFSLLFLLGFYIGSVWNEKSGSVFYWLAHPISVLLLTWIMLRSVGLALWRGGVRWRDDFYTLETLKRNQV